MADWPLWLAGPPAIVGGALSRDSVAAALSVAAASTAWPASNTAIFVPFHLYARTLVAQLVCINGSAVSGNVDCGIYDAVGTRLVSTGSTAQSGANAPQAVDVTDTWIGPGLFYAALAIDNTTGTALGIVPSIQRGRVIGLVEQASAFPLPANATFATLTSNLLPLCGFTSRSVF